MAADEDRARRIQRLKDERPSLTWRAIAEGVGVTERAAAEWGRTGGITFANVRKLARVLSDYGPRVEADYIWLGNGSAEAPGEPVEGEVAARLTAIEAQLAEVLDALTRAGLRPSTPSDATADLLDATRRILDEQDRTTAPTRSRSAAGRQRRSA